MNRIIRWFILLGLIGPTAVFAEVKTYNGVDGSPRIGSVVNDTTEGVGVTAVNGPIRMNANGDIHFEIPQVKTYQFNIGPATINFDNDGGKSVLSLSEGKIYGLSNITTSNSLSVSVGGDMGVTAANLNLQGTTSTNVLMSPNIGYSAFNVTGDNGSTGEFFSTGMSGELTQWGIYAGSFIVLLDSVLGLELNSTPIIGLDSITTSAGVLNVNGAALTNVASVNGAVSQSLGLNSDTSVTINAPSITVSQAPVTTMEVANKGYVDDGDNAAVSIAEDYTDSNLSGAVSTANSYTDGAVSAGVSAAATYTDAHLPAVFASNAVTNSGVTVGPVTLTSTAGLYRVNYYLVDTTSGLGAGTLTFGVNYTDDGGNNSIVSPSVNLTVLDSEVQGSFIVQLESGSLTYQTDLTGIFGTAKYSLYMSAEKIK